MFGLSLGSFGAEGAFVELDADNSVANIVARWGALRRCPGRQPDTSPDHDRTRCQFAVLVAYVPRRFTGSSNHSRPVPGAAARTLEPPTSQLREPSLQSGGVLGNELAVVEAGMDGHASGLGAWVGNGKWGWCGGAEGTGGVSCCLRLGVGVVAGGPGWG